MWIQFRTNVSLFESFICLGPGELWNFLEARMLYDKCIENELWSLKGYEKVEDHSFVC